MTPGKWIFGALAGVAAFAAFPYAPWAAAKVLGTQPVVFLEADGVQRTMVNGPNAPRPDWLTTPPGAIFLSATHWEPSPVQPPAGGLDFLVHADPDAVAAHYAESLAAAGFEVADLGLGTIDPATAGLLGVGGFVKAWSEERRIAATVTIYAPTGLILRPRYVNVQWRKTEAPGG